MLNHNSFEVDCILIIVAKCEMALVSRGVHTPETMMHFPPCFRFFPLFSKKFRTLRTIFTMLPFPEKFLDFHPPKFLMTLFLVIDHKFRISPCFPCFSTFPPCFAKIIISPLVLQISPLFDTNSPDFYILYVY